MASLADLQLILKATIEAIKIQTEARDFVGTRGRIGKVEFDLTPEQTGAVRVEYDAQIEIIKNAVRRF